MSLPPNSGVNSSLRIPSRLELHPIYPINNSDKHDRLDAQYRLLMSSTEPSFRHTGELADEGSQRRTAEQACKECRRRKSKVQPSIPSISCCVYTTALTRSAKCDRAIPTCLLCTRYGRRCLYEKAEKTPLTRRYMTELENELARAKRLLRQFIPGENIDGTQHVDLSLPIEDASHASHAVVQPLQNSGHSGPAESVQRSSSGLRPQDHTPSRVNNDSLTHLPIQQLPSRYEQQRTPSDRRSLPPSALSLETPPSSNNNFEWDERSGNVAGDKFVDGMASLTSNSNEGGYLGK